MNSPHLKGLTGTRFIKALVAARGDPMLATAYAQGQAWRNTPGVERALQAITVSSMDTNGDASLIGEAGIDLADLARPQTILGRLLGVRRVPFTTRLLDQTAFTEGGWVGQGQPIPMTRASFSGATLAPLKVAAAVIVTDELAKSSEPSAESVLSRDLVGAIAQAQDVAFIDVNNAGIANLKPASITFGVTPRVSAGGALADVDADLAALLNELSDAGSTLEFAAWVMRPRTAIYLSKLRGAGGNPAYPFITARGGTLLGLPVLTSANAPVASTSGDPSQITLIDAARVTVADDGDTEVDVAQHATVQLDDAPETGATEQVSLWQCNLVGIKVLRIVNWKARGGQAAAVLSEVEY